MNLPTIDQCNCQGKKTLLRLDLNLPMDGKVITDATRLEKSLPTIMALADKGAKLLIMAHLGRPDGVVQEKYSLRPVYELLAQKLPGYKASFFASLDEAKEKMDDMADGEIALLENIRFYPGEEKNDPDFVKELASLGDIFVGDAFSAAHRAHASTAGLSDYLESFAGLLMQQEIEALTKSLESPTRPVIAIVGGSKISTKISVLKNLLAKVDGLVIGGAMANTFLAAQGVKVGKSLCENDMLETARDIMNHAAATGKIIVLPQDAMLAKELKEGAAHRIAAFDDIKDDEMILDIGPATIQMMKGLFNTAKTVLWNGPVGAFEFAPFDQGTTALAQMIAQMTRDGKLLSVAGGGDTVAALQKAGVLDEMSFVSTAGGAFLEWLEGKTLPGVAALMTAKAA